MAFCIVEEVTIKTYQFVKTMTIGNVLLVMAHLIVFSGTINFSVNVYFFFCVLTNVRV